MGILFRYILQQYLKILFMCQAGLTTIYLVVDFFEKLRRFLKYDAEFLAMLTYFFYKIPDISFKLAPLAALMATLLTIGILNKNQEITAMRSCGFSLIQVSAPFVATGICITLILFAFTAVIIPIANTRAEYTKTVGIEKKSKPSSLTVENLWVRIRDNSILNVEEISPDGTTLRKIQLYRLNPDFGLETLVLADHAHYAESGWLLQSSTQRDLKKDGSIVTTQAHATPLALSLTPEDFLAWMSFEPEHMTLRELRAHIARLQAEGHGIAGFLTDYWGRIAFSFVTLIMTMLGLALGFMKMGTRGGGMAKGIGQALGIGFLFWTTHSVGIALGRSGALLPVLAGWIACIMFFAVSLNLFLKVRY